MLNKRGLVLEESYYLKSIGVKTKEFLQKYFGNEISSSEIAEIYQNYKKEFYNHPEKYIQIQPYVIKCCTGLSNNRYTLAISSSTRKIDILFVLKSLNLNKLFKVIIGSEDTVHSKPDPEVYLKTIAELGYSPKECIAIEDSHIGIKAAKAAGIKCIAVTYTLKRNKLTEADIIIDSLDEVNAEFIKAKFDTF